MATGHTLGLESGLEHVLLMWLDRVPSTSWLVAQPTLLVWADGVQHYPDLLSVADGGVVTVWDARPVGQRDDDFRVKAERTATTCADHGWSYQLFGGLSVQEEVNLRWLAASRRPVPWLDRARASLQQLLAGGEARLGDVLAADPSGHLTAAMWHLAWRGDIALDLAGAWDADTALAWASSRQAS